MKKILIVDDDIAIVRFLKELISSKLHFQYESATSKSALIKLLEHPDEYEVALVDVTLPYSYDGECIDLVLEKGITTIAITDNADKNIQKILVEKNILDYVSKENLSSFNYAVRLIQFMSGFRGSKILLVDDMKTSRMQMRFSLETLPFEIYEAEDGVEALKILNEHNDIRLIITDQNMPNMSGIELIRNVRMIHCFNSLAIIGISASNDKAMSVEFLKNGANDYITKPFSSEEILSRVISNLEMQYYVQLAEESAVRDFLTALHNRKYLYEMGLTLYANVKREGLSMVVAMIDIDHFKKINDRYGHEAGDLALKRLGALLTSHFRSSDIVTRYGGEEFCVILTNTHMKNAIDVMERFRVKTENMLIEFQNISFRMTLSIGLNEKVSSSFDEMISLADEKLYKAKNDGRNRTAY